MQRMIVKAEELAIGDKIIETEDALHYGTVTGLLVSTLTGRVQITMETDPNRFGKKQYFCGSYNPISTHVIHR